MSSSLNTFLIRINQVGVSIACVALMAMMVLTGADVAMRYLLNCPIAGSMEITEYLMSLTTGFGLAYCALKKGHIRVDFILTYIPNKMHKILDIINYILSFAFYSLIVWQTYELGKSLLASKITSAVLYIPVFPFAFLMAIAMATLTIIFLENVISLIRQLFSQ